MCSSTTQLSCRTSSSKGYTARVLIYQVLITFKTIDYRRLITMRIRLTCTGCSKSYWRSLRILGSSHQIFRTSSQNRKESQKNKRAISTCQWQAETSTSRKNCIWAAKKRSALSRRLHLQLVATRCSSSLMESHLTILSLQWVPRRRLCRLSSETQESWYPPILSSV